MEYGEEHGAGEASGESVLLGGVVRGEEGDPVWEFVFCGMGEFVSGAGWDLVCAEEVGKVSIEGDLAEDDDDLEVFQESKFMVEPVGTIGKFFACGLVVRRSAAGAGGDVGVVELEFVVKICGGGLGGEAGLVEDGIEEIAG